MGDKRGARENPWEGGNPFSTNLEPFHHDGSESKPADDEDEQFKRSETESEGSILSKITKKPRDHQPKGPCIDFPKFGGDKGPQ